MWKHVALKALSKPCRVGTKYDPIRGLVVKDAAYSYQGMVEEITFQPRRISVHEDPFDFSLDKRLCNLLDAVVLFV